MVSSPKGDRGCGCSAGDAMVASSMGSGCGCSAGDTMISSSMGDCGCGGDIETVAYDQLPGQAGAAQAGVTQAAGRSKLSRFFEKCRLGGAGKAAAIPAAASAPNFVAPNFGGCGVNGCGQGNQRCHGCLAKLAGAQGGHGFQGGLAGCGVNGCGHGNQRCPGCLAKLAGQRGGPYGGAIPHTAQGPGAGTGTAPSYAYPYYTTRGPRDFLMKNPPSIGY